MTIAGGTIPTQAIGRKQSGLLLAESAIGAISGDLTGGDRFDFLSLSVDPTREKIERVDKRQTPNIAEVVKGKRSATWAFEAYLLNAAAGVAPDTDKVFQGASLAGTVDAGVSITYAPSATLTPFALLDDEEVVSKLAHGCVTQELSIAFDGTDLTKISASGIASYAVKTGTSTLSGNEAAGQTDLSVTSESAFNVGSYIQVGADNNSGDGYRVTAAATGQITVTPALVTGASSGDAVGPVMPVISTTGTPISGILGSCTVGGDTVEIMSGSVTISNEFGSQQDKFGVQSYDVAPVLTDRRVTFEMTLYGKRANFLKWAQDDAVTTTAIVVNIGDTAPNRCQISMPYSVLEVNSTEVPETEFVTFTLSGKAMKSSGNDEISIKLY